MGLLGSILCAIDGRHDFIEIGSAIPGTKKDDYDLTGLYTIPIKCARCGKKMDKIVSSDFISKEEIEK